MYGGVPKPKTKRERERGGVIYIPVCLLCFEKKKPSHIRSKRGRGGEREGKQKEKEKKPHSSPLPPPFDMPRPAPLATALAVAAVALLATAALAGQGTDPPSAHATPAFSLLAAVAGLPVETFQIGNLWRGRQSPLAASSYVGLPYVLANFQGERERKGRTAACGRARWGGSGGGWRTRPPPRDAALFISLARR